MLAYRQVYGVLGQITNFRGDTINYIERKATLLDLSREGVDWG